MRLLVALFVALAVEGNAAAQAPPVEANARATALRALANRLDLPLVDESIAIFSRQLRRTLPTYVVTSIGANAGLGAQWKRGDPRFDEALRQVDAALGAEEARAGPLLAIEHADLLLAVDIPWTRDDIAFVDETIDTELGRQAQRALDAKAALQATNALRRRVATGAGGSGIAEAFVDLEARANAQFGDAALMLLPLRATDPPRAQRLQRLLEAVKTAPSDALGQRLTERLSQRLLDAALAQLPNVLATIANFNAARR